MKKFNWKKELDYIHETAINGFKCRALDCINKNDDHRFMHAMGRTFFIVNIIPGSHKNCVDISIDDLDKEFIIEYGENEDNIVKTGRELLSKEEIELLEEVTDFAQIFGYEPFYVKYGQVLTNW